MKEYRRLKKDVPGKQLVIPIAEPMTVGTFNSQEPLYPNIIAITFDHNTIYEFESYYDPFEHEPFYKHKNSSYYKVVQLSKNIVNKYFMDEKEMHNDEFNGKMDKLLE